MTTAAGKRLWQQIIGVNRRWPSTQGIVTPGDIRAIEAEAVAAVSGRLLATQPEGCAVNCPECKTELPPDWCGHADILDANNADIRDRDEALAMVRNENARLRKIEDAARDISRRTFVDDGVVAHVPFYKLYALRQTLYGSDEEIIAALDALDESER